MNRQFVWNVIPNKVIHCLSLGSIVKKKMSPVPALNPKGMI